MNKMKHRVILCNQKQAHYGNGLKNAQTMTEKPFAKFARNLLTVLDGKPVTESNTWKIFIKF